MSYEKVVLILGGTGEAFELAAMINALTGWRAVTSMAGRTKRPRRPVGEVIFGGFGGPEGLGRCLAERGALAMIDATHPFASQITRNAVQACTKAEIPLLRLDRPPWLVRQSWRLVSDIGEAARLFRGRKERVFLTIGKKELGEFGNVGDSFFLIRTVDPVEASPSNNNHEFVTGRGPYSVEGELQIMRDYGITWLVTKNSGGEVGMSKLIAAEQAGVSICVIERPKLPECESVETPAEAARW
ncbi:MAG: cobalt-precorrin-6A reductase, partial [Nitrospinaceae bacterium]|nr:cobalt-precorrin-6A reductase [Nitrospinaceae bacterium]